MALEATDGAKKIMKKLNIKSYVPKDGEKENVPDQSGIEHLLKHIMGYVSAFRE